MTALSSLNIDLESSHDRDDDFIDDGKKKKKRKGMFSTKKDLLIDKDAISKDKERKDRKSKREKSSSVTHVGGNLVTNTSAPSSGTPVVVGSIIGSDVIAGDLGSAKAMSRSSIDTLTADDDSPTSIKTPKKLGTPGKATKDKEKKHKSKVADTKKLKPPPGPPAPNYVPGPPVLPRTTSAGSESPLRVGLSAEASIVMARRNQQAHTNPSGRVGLTGEGAIIMKQRKKKYNTLPTDLSKIGRTDSMDDTGLHRADTLEEMEYVDQTGDFGISSGSLKLGRPGSPSLQVSHTVEWRGKQLPVEVSLVSFDTVAHSVAQAFGIDLEFMKSICLSLKLEYCLPGEGGDYIEISEDNLNLTLAGAGGILRVVVVDDD